MPLQGYVLLQLKVMAIGVSEEPYILMYLTSLMLMAEVCMQITQSKNNYNQDGIYIHWIPVCVPVTWSGQSMLWGSSAGQSESDYARLKCCSA